MIAIDAVQNALRSPQPWSALDELVRAELAAGRLTDHIHDELAATLDEVRAAPDHDEDREEPLLDTLDRLNGFCRADISYRNPPVLPTEDEIAKLPRWARVAFAARCARRVLPLFGVDQPTTLYRYREALADAVQLAEILAATTSPPPFEYESTRSNASSARIGTEKASYAVASLVLLSLDCNQVIERFVVSPLEFSRELRKHAVQFPHVTEPFRRDFDHLARLAYAFDWTDGTPVPPEVFGPLWPEGKPAGWPDDSEFSKRTDIALEAVASERATATMIEDEVVNLFLAMNRFHIARTGHPLTVEDFHPFLAALVPAGV